LSRRRLIHPREIEVVAEDETSIHVRFPEGRIKAFPFTHLAAMAVEAIRDPSSTQELPAAVIRKVIGENRWREATEMVATVDAAFGDTGGLRDAVGSLSPPS
jgi:hypothetical protein